MVFVRIVGCNVFLFWFIIKIVVRVYDEMNYFCFFYFDKRSFLVVVGYKVVKVE